MKQNTSNSNLETTSNFLTKKDKESKTETSTKQPNNDNQIIDSQLKAAKIASKLAELRCKIRPFKTLSPLKYVVVCSFYKGKMLLSRRRDRSTWETQGGHIEDGETAEDAAHRELFEESGVSDAKIYPVCDYIGYNSTDWANGAIFYADVNSIGEMPEYEMAEVKLFDELPKNLTYPNATPEFFKMTKKLIFEMSKNESTTSEKQEVA